MEARFANIADPAVQADLCSLPALFMYERALRLPGWRGKVTAVCPRAAGVELHFEVDRSLHIEWDVLDPIIYRLKAQTTGIELSNTHWAVKDVDLNSTLARVYPALRGTAAVASPTPEITSEAVERALRDAEYLITTKSAASAVDRVHTAIQGYLMAVARKAALATPPEAGVTDLFKVLREGHPALVESGPRAADIKKIVRNISAILDALNPLRNWASLSHPNEEFLGEPEAMLVVNSVRTLLHYLDARLRAQPMTGLPQSSSPTLFAQL